MNFFQSMSTKNGETKINVNGKSIIVKGNNVSVINGKIIVDGKVFKDNDIFKDDYIIQNVVVEGDVKNIDVNGSVTVNGNVNGNIDSNGSVTIHGTCTGDIDSNGGVKIIQK